MAKYGKVAPKVLKVKNWSEFQHYKKRNPPWVKLHRSILLDDFEFWRLPDASRALAPCLWLLASESENGTVPADIEWLAFRLHQNSDWVKSALKHLLDSGFFEDASDMLARCYQDAIPETETETETEERQRRTVFQKNGSSPAETIFSHWNSFDVLTNHRALTGKMRSAVKARLKEGRSEADLCQAVARYAELCGNGTAPGYCKWSLSELLGTKEGEYVDRMLDPNYCGIRGSPQKTGATAEPYLGRSAWTPPDYTAEQLASVADAVKRVKAAVKGDGDVERVKARIAAVEAEVKKGADGALLRAALAKETR